jgi:hypothetical protein
VSHRVIRKSKLAGVQDARVLVETVLMAELLAPSDTIWLISPWISDVAIFDNGGGGFGSVFPEAGERQIRLSEVLISLATAGVSLVIAVRPDDLNAPFLNAIKELEERSDHALVQTSAELHEKTLAGADFVLSGSMNFTTAGLDHNEEQVRLDLEPEVVAATRRELRARWGPKVGGQSP